MRYELRVYHAQYNVMPNIGRFRDLTQAIRCFKETAVSHSACIVSLWDVESGRALEHYAPPMSVN